MASRRPGSIAPTLLAVVGAALALSTAHAQPQHSPLIDDDWKWFESSNRSYVALAGPKKRSTIVFHRLAPGSKETEKIWEMPGWDMWSYLSDDGDYVVRCGVDPAGPRTKPTDPMVSIFKRGTLIKGIRLDEIVTGPSPFWHTRRWLAWGHCKGFVGLHDYSLVTLESRRLIYDVTTGKLVENVLVDRGKPASETTMDDLWSDPPVGRTVPGAQSKPEPRRADGTGGASAEARAPVAR